MTGSESVSNQTSVTLGAQTGGPQPGVSEPARSGRRSGPKVWLLLVLMAVLGSLIFLLTAYGMTRVAEGLPRYVSVLSAMVVLAALSLAIMVGGSLLELFRETREGVQGARLHRRLVGLLTIVAVIPAIMAFVLTGTILRAFSDQYFVERVRDANLVARDLANGYATAESRKMGLQVVQLAADLSRQSTVGVSPEQSPIGFRRYLLGQSILRGFSGVTVLDGSGTIVAEVRQNPDARFKLPPASAFAAVSDPTATPFKFNALNPEQIDTYFALLHLRGQGDGYLVAYKEENPVLSSSLVRVREFREETSEVRERLAELSRTFAFGYGLVMALLLLAAVWVGMIVANAIVGPVRRLATAAEAVSSGDLTSRVVIQEGDAELGDLGHMFNYMTTQLEGQRADLIAANAQSDARRRFIETVISAVPAGVLNISPKGRIALANPSAARILGGDQTRMTGLHMAELAPELAPLLEEANHTPGLDVRDQIELQRDGMARIINVRMTPDDADFQSGFVVTLDDITELVSAQRNTAWGDVARRIAHEIKNPLTPIQLSAERLKRKYRKALPPDDIEIFDRCTDTIVRHVGDIGRMVNEFSSFARMPEPIIAKEDLAEIIRAAAFQFGVAHPNVEFRYDMADDPVWHRCDGRLIGQAIVNLVKNAVESITEAGDREDGLVLIALRATDERVQIDVRDNGRGLPKEGRSRLTEPYMTTREKGTGLGLAIVRKAVEEHGGSFELIAQGANGGEGATARILLPRQSDDLSEDAAGQQADKQRPSSAAVIGD